jgi:hypothetical protein
MQRNATSDEISSGSPTRRAGVRARMLSTYSSLDRSCARNHTVASIAASDLTSYNHATNSNQS